MCDQNDETLLGHPENLRILSHKPKLLNLSAIFKNAFDCDCLRISVRQRLNNRLMNKTRSSSDSDALSPLSSPGSRQNIESLKRERRHNSEKNIHIWQHSNLLWKCTNASILQGRGALNPSFSGRGRTLLPWRERESENCSLLSIFCLFDQLLMRSLWLEKLSNIRQIFQLQIYHFLLSKDQTTHYDIIQTLYRHYTDIIQTFYRH